MGWTGYNLYGKTPKQEIDGIFNGDENYKVLRSCMKGSTYYGAIERTMQNGEKIVFAAVWLTYYNPRAKHTENFGYKDMDETMMPYQFNCPKTILDLLTPTDNKYALDWRRKCKENNDKKSKLNKLPIGSKIEFICEYNLSGGIKEGDEICLYKNRSKKWTDGYYHWKQSLIPNKFKVINN